MDYKYVSRFEVKANLKKNDFVKGSFVSKASMGLDDLKGLLPENEEIKNNPDLLYTCFNAAVVNLINLNGDGITTEGAKKMVESCRLKPMNIEHSRGDIIGVITNYGFSSFNKNKLLNPDELTDDPFNISLAAIVWKLSNRSFAEFIESSQDEEEFSYSQVSTSWEVGFNSFKLALGSKDLRKARILEAETEVEEYSKFLLSMGGTGFTPEGEEVYRIIGDDCRFLGCAFTTNPAAAVKGVLSVDYKSLASEEETEKEEEQDEVEDEVPKEKEGTEENEDEKNISISSELFSENDKPISPNKKTRVIKYMKYKNIDELVDHLQEAAASDVREFIVSQVESANSEFTALKIEKEAKEQELQDALANLNSVKEDAKSLQKQLDEVKATLKAQEDQSKFNERMESLKEEFEVDQAAAKTISKTILGLSDESFAEWLEDMKPLLKQKKSSVDTEPKEKEVKASVNPVLPNSLAEGKDKKTQEWKDSLSKIKVKITKQ